LGRPKVKKALVTKIAEAFRAVAKLERNCVNEARRYRSVRASDVYEAVREELFSRGVLMCPSEGEPHYVDNVAQSNGGESINECRLPVTYVFQDESGKLDPPMTVNGIGRDVEDKALYKAQTGAQKALLRRFGLLAEQADEFDGDSDGSDQAETIDEAAPMRSPTRKREQPLRDFEISALENAFADTNKTTAEIYEGLLTRFKAAQLSDLKRYQFKEALAWASNGAGTLAPKPQAAPALQESMPFPKAAPSFEMRVGGKTHVIEPKTGSFSL
jgi:hypothetical protein